MMFSQLADFIKINKSERGSNLSKYFFNLLTNINEKQNFNNTSEDYNILGYK